MLVVNRDDVVFFIFLYQRYIYKMDPTRSMSFFWNLYLQSFFLVSRVNEFGVSAEMLEKREVEGTQDPNKTTPALEGTQPEVEQSVQAEAPKPKQKSKKAKKVD